MIDEADLLPLQLIKTAQLLSDMLYGNVRRGPVAAHGNEAPRKHRTVFALRAPIAEREERDLITWRLFGQRIRDAGRKRREIAGAGGTFAFQALVAFDALVRGVAGLTLLKNDLDAINAAVPLVDERPVVDGPIRERDAVRRVWALR